MWKTLAQPKIVVAVLLSIALLAFLFSISDIPGVMAHIRELPLSAILFNLLLAVVYLALKFFLWRKYMSRLDIRANNRQLLLAFAVGEMTLNLPVGEYAPNYVLGKICGADFGRSSAATSAVLVVEGGVTLVALLTLGVPGWFWLRPLLLVICVAAGSVVALLALFRAARRLTAKLARIGPLRTVGTELDELFRGLQTLWTPGLLAIAIPLAACYLFAIVVAFYTVARGVGAQGFTLYQAGSVYLFALAVVLLNPISSHLGVIEVSGFSAMQAWGYSADQAFAALLGFRLVWTGVTWLICGSMVLALNKEFNLPAQPETC